MQSSKAAGREPDVPALVRTAAEDALRDLSVPLEEGEQVLHAATNRAADIARQTAINVEDVQAAWTAEQNIKRHPLIEGLGGAAILAALIAFALFILCALRGATHFTWVPAVRLGALGWLQSSGVYAALSVGFAAIGGATVTDSAKLRSAREERERAQALLHAAINTQTKSLVLEIINGIRRRTRTVNLLLSTQRAPRLVELNIVEAVTSNTAERVITFIDSHESAAIGISGPRGVGKSTLMRQLCSLDSARYIGVYIAAPVSYAASEFVRLIHGEVARAVLGSLGEDIEEVRRPSTTLARRLWGLALVGAGVWVIYWGRTGTGAWIKPTDVAGLTLATAGMGAYLASLLASVRNRSRNPARNPAALCQNELQQLKWSSRTQSSTKNELTARILRMSDEDTVELAERQLTHPEQVASFRGFTARLHNLTDKSLIIAIDELDKMEDPSDALAVVNGIKDLMHSAGTHIVVSVSEDALTSFALRGVPLRDAFDSSFDLIVPVARFTPEHALTLMAQRVLEFPQPLTLFCHAIGGGLPRDIIRHARHCIDIRREVGHEVSLAHITSAVARAHAGSLLDAAVARLRATDRSQVGAYTKMRRLVESDDNVVVSLERVAENARDIAPSTEEIDDLRLGLAVVLDVLAVATEYFGSSRAPQEWAHELDTGRAKVCAAALSEAVAAVAIDPANAMDLLSFARSKVQALSR